VAATFRIDLHQQGVDLIAQAYRLRQGSLAFGGKQFEHGGIVICRHRAEGGRLLSQECCHGPSVQPVSLPWSAPAAAA
jgi:hypothetical protein